MVTDQGTVPSPPFPSPQNKHARSRAQAVGRVAPTRSREDAELALGKPGEEAGRPRSARHPQPACGAAPGGFKVHLELGRE